ncbi:MAG: hypothetical protein R3B06_21635 [Kofleriaceae bacterium]
MTAAAPPPTDTDALGTEADAGAAPSRTGDDALTPARPRGDGDTAPAAAAQADDTTAGDDDGAAGPAWPTAPPTTDAELRASLDGPLAPRPPRTATAPDLDGPRRSRRWPALLAAGGTVITLVAVLIVLGKLHAQRYALRCHAKEVVAERGRSFPPWGWQRLGGPAWQPIAIPPDAECTAHETGDPAELEGWFLTHLTEQATRKLSGDGPGDLDRAERELEQALLLARSPERRDLRKELERLRGDVTYWRATAKLKAAAATLAQAATDFDAAAAQRPRHAADPGRWAAFARAVADTLVAGPDGQPASVPTAPSRPLAPAGVALPVEPGPAEQPVDAGVPVDARSTLPTGGVLM